MKITKNTIFQMLQVCRIFKILVLDILKMKITKKSILYSLQILWIRKN